MGKRGRHQQRREICLDAKRCRWGEGRFGPAGAFAQKVTVLNSEDDNQPSDFDSLASFSLILKGYSELSGKRPFF